MHLWIQRMVIRASRDQLAFDQSPELIAVFHALLRLLAPRHPPHALSSLAALILPSAGRPARCQDRLSSHRPCLQGTAVVTIHSLFLRLIQSLTRNRNTGGKPPAPCSCEAT